jgi:hypothetical protein
MEIIIAEYRHANIVVDFFGKHLDSNNDGIYGTELLCPDGARVASKNNRIIIAVEDTKIVGAMRFYRRKMTNIVSLYQFAIIENYRGKDLMRKMLDKLDGEVIEVICGMNSNFNNYYSKTGWQLYAFDNRLKRWRMKINEMNVN